MSAREDGTERPKVIAEAHKDERKIVLYVRQNFGDGKNFDGLELADPDAEREEMHQILDDALDVLMGRKKSVVPIERWMHISLVDGMTKEQQ